MKGMLPQLHFTPAMPTNLDEVLERQVRELIKISVPMHVGVDKAKYLDDAMTLVGKFEFRIDLAEIGLDQVWLVEYRLPDRFLAEASGVNSYYNLEMCEVHDGVIVPDGLKVVQGQLGPKYQNTASHKVLEILNPLEEGGIIKEGLCAYQYWGDDLLRKYSMVFPRSHTPGGSVPFLYLSSRGTMLVRISDKDEDPELGSVSREKYSVV